MVQIFPPIAQSPLMELSLFAKLSRFYNAFPEDQRVSHSLEEDDEGSTPSRSTCVHDETCCHHESRNLPWFAVFHNNDPLLVHIVEIKPYLFANLIIDNPVRNKMLPTYLLAIDNEVFTNEWR